MESESNVYIIIVNSIDLITTGYLLTLTLPLEWWPPRTLSKITINSEQWSLDGIDPNG